MISFKDFLSETVAQQLTTMSFAAGAVFHCYTQQTKPPKNKFIIIVGTNVDVNTNVTTVAFIFINTDPPYYYGIEVSATDINCLTHNSYIDCSSLLEEDSTQLLNITYKCSLSSELLHEVLSTLSNAKTIPRKLIKKYNL